MPATPKSTPTKPKAKPYDRTSTSPSSDISDTKPDLTTPTKSKTKMNKNSVSPRQPRPWTNEELGQLFEHVLKSSTLGMKGFEGAVEGRNANQCYQSWMNTLAPFLKKAIATKGGKTG
ncbi:hypothetical protein CI109_106921 [Kwoniella shandongensis]|uniref:Uncharacterized protein n=1 Tax=Kwoniella shandongensis TaxID=1734106 RepID=A0A5M6C686_9TREE|nr:uncharacterized protein CI109_000824 [Kwoniella shandongensis]KAA5530644.1 hypothetical protein CI109_000824 [Kwoniella shandongensis]